MYIETNMVSLVAAGSLPLAALRTCVWALSNLVRGKPAPPLATVSSALPILAELSRVDDEEVLTDVCWGRWTVWVCVGHGCGCVVLCWVGGWVNLL